jgi:predicted MFS family arabinose efflux permease
MKENGLQTKSILIYAFSQVLIFSLVKNIIGPLIPVISDQLNAGLDLIGSIISLSIFGLILISFLSGNLIELIGLKKVLYAGQALHFAGTALMYFSKGFSSFMIAYFLIQLGIGIIFICNLSMVGIIYNRKRSEGFLKINIGATISLVIAPLAASLILFLKSDWHVFFLFHLVLQTAIIVLLIRLKLPENVKANNNIKTLFAANKKIFKNPQFILCSVITFFYAPVVNIFYVWFTSYFESIGIGTQLSSVFLAIFSFSIVIGMIVKNRLVKFYREKRIIFYTFILSFLTLGGIFLIDNLILKNILIFTFGVSIAGNFALSFSIGMELMPDYTGSASGLMLTFANLGVLVFQYVSGYLSEYWSKDSVFYITFFILAVLIALTSVLNFGRKF